MIRRLAATSTLLFVGVILPVQAVGAGAASPHATDSRPFVVVLGIAQDGGYPQAGCRKECCRKAWSDRSRRKWVASLGIVDGPRRYLIDATPDFREQLRMLDEVAPEAASPGLDGIFLTHGHIGHYTGLMQLGREVIGSKDVPVYGMPRMTDFLKTSGPWEQLVKLGNVKLQPLEAGRPVTLGAISITPLPVPHRDEYTETVGFIIRGASRALLYLPDIDKWSRWSTPLVDALAGVDIAYLDGTFYGEGELPGRNMAEIPHPFISETLSLLSKIPPEQRAKVRFIHLNHTNPALDPQSDAVKAIRAAGMRVAVQGEKEFLAR
jgi:pyrroloquinoline quinone biosynthesis protein B